ncbi:protein FAM177B isoform X2 [Ambystoma mexicanum]|uniref:protein FAM177B isoform X2 n=1 Tax=Ambystoma mexicanum TaxID=8296 RepID=UPI0037E6FD9D
MEDTERIIQDKLEHEDLEKSRTPRRVIHFSSGEMMEEFSTDEEEAETNTFQTVDTSKLSWGPYLQFWALRVATASFFTCEFLGGKLATLFGLNVPKYQYAVDEYSRRNAEQSEDEDGEVLPQIQMSPILSEKQHLETQGTAYGSISLEDRASHTLKSTVTNIDETTGDALGRQYPPTSDAN